MFNKIDYEILLKFVESIKESSLGSMLNMMGGEKALEPLREPLTKKLKRQLMIYEEPILWEKRRFQLQLEMKLKI